MKSQSSEMIGVDEEGMEWMGGSDGVNEEVIEWMRK